MLNTRTSADAPVVKSMRRAMCWNALVCQVFDGCNDQPDQTGTDQVGLDI